MLCLVRAGTLQLSTRIEEQKRYEALVRKTGQDWRRLKVFEWFQDVWTSRQKVETYGIYRWGSCI